MSTSNAAATAVNTAPSQAPVDPFDDPVTSNKMAVRALIPLLITFVLGTLCLQGFNLVFQQVGADVGAPAQASLITAFPSIVLGTIEKDESGRGVGMNDLAMNVSPSIGIAIIGSLLGSNALAGSSVAGATGDAANYSNLLLIAAGTALLGLIVFFVFKKKIYEGNHALETEESAK